MSDQPATPRELIVKAATAIWANKAARVLLLVLLAFEIYNNAVLPAIQGTYGIGKLKAEACSAKMKAIIDTVPMNELGAANARLMRECGSYYTGE
ncbi:MAG: hypothetical protein ACLPWS_10780 [Rhodomicrobium sp.]